MEAEGSPHSDRVRRLNARTRRRIVFESVQDAGGYSLRNVVRSNELRGLHRFNQEQDESIGM